MKKTSSFLLLIRPRIAFLLSHNKGIGLLNRYRIIFFQRFSIVRKRRFKFRSRVIERNSLPSKLEIVIYEGISSLKLLFFGVPELRFFATKRAEPNLQTPTLWQTPLAPARTEKRFLLYFNNRFLHSEKLSDTYIRINQLLRSRGHEVIPYSPDQDFSYSQIGISKVDYFIIDGNLWTQSLHENLLQFKPYGIPMYIIMQDSWNSTWLYKVAKWATLADKLIYFHNHSEVKSLLKSNQGLYTLPFLSMQDNEATLAKTPNLNIAFSGTVQDNRLEWLRYTQSVCDDLDSVNLSFKLATWHRDIQGLFLDYEDYLEWLSNHQAILNLTRKPNGKNIINGRVSDSIDVACILINERGRQDPLSDFLIPFTDYFPFSSKRELREAMLLAAEMNSQDRLCMTKMAKGRAKEALNNFCLELGI